MDLFDLLMSGIIPEKYLQELEDRKMINKGDEYKAGMFLPRLPNPENNFTVENELEGMTYEDQDLTEMTRDNLFIAARLFTSYLNKFSRSSSQTNLSWKSSRDTALDSDVADFIDIIHSELKLSYRGFSYPVSNATFCLVLSSRVEGSVPMLAYTHFAVTDEGLELVKIEPVLITSINGEMILDTTQTYGIDIINAPKIISQTPEGLFYNSAGFEELIGLFENIFLEEEDNIIYQNRIVDLGSSES